MLAAAGARAAVSPSLWLNDDFPELGSGYKPAHAFAGARLAGFAGIDITARFPQDAEALRAALFASGLAAAGGALELRLVKNGVAGEREDFEKRLDLFAAAACSVVVVTDVTGEIFSRKDGALFGPSLPSLPREVWDKFAAGLELFAGLAEDKGLALAYRPRLGTLVQERKAIDRVLSATRKTALCLDAGHLEVAGVSPAVLARDAAGRIGHVLLKRPRREVVRDMGSGRVSYIEAVRRGLFAPPGEGREDYSEFFAALASAGYAGWVVAAAEQDSSSKDPARAAAKAREFLKTRAGI